MINTIVRKLFTNYISIIIDIKLLLIECMKTIHCFLLIKRFYRNNIIIIIVEILFFIEHQKMMISSEQHFASILIT